MIKEFTRSSAGQEAAKPDELRPAKVLLQVVEYLVNRLVSYWLRPFLIIYLSSRVLPRTDVSFNIVYDYIFDRLRAVRQDMSIQCLSGPECISILEQAVRFHIYSEYRYI
jgi:SAC3 domain-containing protein 1